MPPKLARGPTPERQPRHPAEHRHTLGRGRPGHAVPRYSKRGVRQGPNDARWDGSQVVLPAHPHEAEPVGDGREVGRRRKGAGRTLPPLAVASIGYYGPGRGDELLTEDSPPGAGFLADVVTGWEAASDPARYAGPVSRRSAPTSCRAHAGHLAAALATGRGRRGRAARQRTPVQRQQKLGPNCPGAVPWGGIAGFGAG